METIVFTYKLLVRSILHYAAPVWFPNTAPSNIEKLQRAQNSALRIATGCVKRTPIPCTCMKKLKSSHPKPPQPPLSTVSGQSTPAWPPLSQHCNFHPGPIRTKETLLSSFFTPSFYPSFLLQVHIQQLHTDMVRRSLAGLPSNEVLRTRPPPILTEEQSLTCAHRTTLTRLRS